jgi:nickel/cobalt exporter
MWRRLVAIAVLFAGTCGSAIAHPLGNFTINHLAMLRAHDGVLHVRYVLDIAEIPTFQIMRASSSTGTWDASDLTRWAQSEVPVVEGGLRVSVDGTALPLKLVDEHARIRPGAAGLPLLYWVADFTAPIGQVPHRVQVLDVVYGDRRIGWKDIVVAPATEPTSELRRYPSALIGSPRQINEVNFNLAPDGVASDVVSSNEAAPDVNGSSSIIRVNALSDMFSNANRTPLFVLLTVLVAFGLGALHAIEPGHGKALLAFTLVGSRATVRQAIVLAASLTFAHTIGVFILGFVLFFAVGFASESIYPWITLISGAAVAVIGARNLAGFMRGRFGHSHADGVRHQHHFSGDHHHGDGADKHSHAIPGTAPIRFRGAVVAALSGGVAPCPAAIVVMLAALRLHQLGYGMFLIVIFSMGLAAVLTGLGLAVVHGSAFISRSGKFDRLVQFGPLISAILISIVGAIMVAQGFVTQGVPVSMWAIAGLCALAIAGYALIPAHNHAGALGDS